MTQDDPMLRLRYYKETGQDAEAKQYEAYLRDTGQYKDADPNAALHASYTSGRLAKNVADKNAAENMGWVRTNLGGAVDALLGGVETLAAGVPGAKLAMSAGRRYLSPDTRTMPEIQRDINERTSDIPYASATMRGIGSLVPLFAGPAASLSAAKGGAALMGLDQLLNNDPMAEGQSLPSNLLDRGMRAVGGAIVGGAGGKAGEVVATTTRSLLAPSLGKTADVLKGAMREADNALYGAAESEGAKVGTTPEIQAVLKSKTVAPFASIVRNSETFAGANDATILRETYKLMSEQAVRRGTAMANAADYKAGSSLEKADLDKARGRMLDAADTAMPSFRKAVETHAVNAKIKRAFAMGANASRRELSNTSVAGERVEKLSPTATRSLLARMSKPEAEAFTNGVLGRTFERMTPGANPINLFGLPRAAQAIYRAGPLLRAADKASGHNATIIGERGLIAMLNAMSP